MSVLKAFKRNSLASSILLLAASLAASPLQAASLGRLALTQRAAQAGKMSRAGEDIFESVKIYRDASGGLSLKTYCADLPDMLGALAGWKTRFGEAVGSLPEIRKEGVFCSATISGITPDRIAGLHGTTTRQLGPNCWNTALYSAQVALTRRASDPEEIRFWTHSPVCRELAPGEPHMPGDIISASGPGDTPEFHAFVYITDKLGFAKDGFDVQFLYELKSLEVEYMTSALGPEYAPASCRNAMYDHDGCNTWANHYRCTPYNEYVAGAQIPERKSFLAADRELTETEKKISDIAVSGVWAEKARVGLEAEIGPVEKLALTRTAAYPEDAMWKSLLVRIASFRTQFDVMDRFPVP